MATAQLITKKEETVISKTVIANIPNTIKLELSISEAIGILGILSKTTGKILYEPYKVLNNIIEFRYIKDIYNKLNATPDIERLIKEAANTFMKDKTQEVSQ